MSLYVPTSLFFGLFVLLFIFMLFAFRTKDIPGIIISLISTMISFYMGQIVINGQLIENIGGLNRDTGDVVQGVTVIQFPALSYVFTFIGLAMTGLTIYHVWLIIREKNNKFIVKAIEPVSYLCRYE